MRIATNTSWAVVYALPAALTVKETGAHQHEGAERGECGQARARALDSKTLLDVTEASDQQAQTDHAVADDHHRRVDGVASNRSARLAAGRAS